MQRTKRALSILLAIALLLPTILQSNFVYAAEKSTVIADFADLDEPTITVNKKSELDDVLNKLPKKVKATFDDGSERYIKASWECVDDYENTEYDLYTFNLVLPDGYTMASENVEIPYIDVEISSRKTDKDTRILYPENNGSNLTIDKKFGCTQDVGAYLQKMYDTDPDYYLGTPYYDSVFKEPYTDWLLANGATADKKSGHMNCTGFVADVIRKCGGNLNLCTNRLPGWYANASNWNDFANGAYKKSDGTWDQDMSKACKTYRFDTIDAALKSGVLEKGDIIFFEPKNWSTPEADCHIGFFFGDTSNENKFWHSATHPKSGNQISEITPKVTSYLYVFKTYHSSKTGGLSIQKQSADTSISDQYNNGYYSLKGAKYGVYSDSTCKTLVTTITTNASGYAATKDNELKEGIYYVKEIEASVGYELDKTVYTFDVEGGKVASKNKQTSSEPPKTAKIELQKKSGDPEVTEGNENYSLKDAEYTVYRDKDCTEVVGVIKTNENGYGALIGLPLGIYFVKETKASPGYALDTKVYTANVSSGSTAEISTKVTSTEIPLLDPVTIILKKVDSETGNNNPQGNGSLKDAQFLVKYYNVIMDTDPEKSGYKAESSWVFKTDKDGFLAFDKDYFVSGDELYLDSTGLPSLPFGTLTFQEIKAPQGYLLNPEIIVSKINKTASYQPIYHEPTVKENILKLNLKKIQDGTSKVIGGAVFEHTNPDGTTEKLTTDKNGNITIKGLQWGNHTIREISAPDGYVVNTSVIKFKVSETNEITFEDQNIEETETNGEISMEVNKEGNIDITVENKVAPFTVQIHKVNNKNKVLEGAEFTLYSDKDCKHEVAKEVSDSKGSLEFENLTVGQEYYLKETKAPKGYRLPVNADGSDIVYKIKVESTPVDNVFNFYVNDKVYTNGSTGNITVDSADRLGSITIVNNTGAKLPNTGSNKTILFYGAGSALMVLAAMISRKRRI